VREFQAGARLGLGQIGVVRVIEEFETRQQTDLDREMIRDEQVYERVGLSSEMVEFSSKYIEICSFWSL
jgi:hypothetical protein